MFDTEFAGGAQQSNPLNVIRKFLGFVMVERLFLALPRGCLRFVIVVIPDHTHLLFLIAITFR